MSSDAPEHGETRQIIIPDHAWEHVERFFNANGVALGRLPEGIAAADDIPTYILVPTEEALRRAAQEIAAEEGL